MSDPSPPSATEGNASGAPQTFDSEGKPIVKKEKPKEVIEPKREGLIDALTLMMGLRKITKAEIIENDRQARIHKQFIMEMMEINFTWKFVFGNEIPKLKSEIFEIKNCTPRQVWMEPDYLFNIIKSHKPEQYYHSINLYSLKWQPPGSSYRLLIPLDDPQIQENALIRMSKMNPIQQANMIFYFAPLHPSLPLFAPYVHPSSLISYREKNDVFKKICSQYVEGKLDIVEFEKTMSCGYDVWKVAMFNMLPPDEQVFHTYLLDKPVQVSSISKVERQYINDEVSLKEFEDLKFPERKKLKDMAALPWPQPYETDICVICRGEFGRGIIKCNDCENYACRSCMEAKFLTPETKEGSFLLMHRRYCLKLGGMVKIEPVVIPEPGYLRILRMTGRSAALDRLTPNLDAANNKANKEEDVIDEEALYQERMRLEREQEEEERRLRECPPELEDQLYKMERNLHKYQKIFKELKKTQLKLDETGHSDTYYERERRIKDDVIEKVIKNKEHLEHNLNHIVELNIYGKVSSDAIVELNNHIRYCQFLLEMKNFEEFDQKVEFMATAAAMKKEQDLLLAFSSVPDKKEGKKVVLNKKEITENDDKVKDVIVDGSLFDDIFVNTPRKDKEEEKENEKEEII